MPSTSKKQERFNKPCEGCGTGRFYNLYELERGRHLTGFCQPCGVKSYNLLKPKKSLEEKKLWQANYYQANKKEFNLYYLGYRERIKREVIDHYGGKCLHCGESDIVVLNIDHIFNDGHLDKKNGLRGGFKLYQWLKRNNFPQGRHQVLCFNCNYRKEHKRRRDAFFFRQAS